MENLLDLLRIRHSIRAYKETQLSPELVEMTMQAALMSPASKHSNPWQFVLVDDKALLNTLSHCKKSGAQFLENVPLAVVVLADPSRSDVWIEDASIAALLIQLEAEDLGLGSCWVQVRGRDTEGGEDAETFVRRVLSIPEDLRVLTIVALGVKDEEKRPFDESKLQWEKIHLNTYGTVE